LRLVSSSAICSADIPSPMADHAQLRASMYAANSSGMLRNFYCLLDSHLFAHVTIIW
jgi:hypothetical protein